MATTTIKIIGEGTLVDVGENKRNILAKEVSRLAQMANKRLQRLENNDLTMTSAYRTWESQGKPHYSVKGKDYQGLQSEYWKIKKVIDNTTSTVRGANAYLRKSAGLLGFNSNDTLANIKSNLSGYWELYSKVEQYMSTIENEGYNIGSPRLQEMVSNYVKTNKGALQDVDSINDSLENIVNQIQETYGISPTIQNWHTWIE